MALITVEFTDETPSKKRKLSLQKEENEGLKVQPTSSAALGSASASTSSLSSSSSSSSSSSAGCSKETEADELFSPIEEQEDTDWLEVLEKTVTDLKRSVEKKG
jgi:hypothetical protein